MARTRQIPVISQWWLMMSRREVRSIRLGSWSPMELLSQVVTLNQGFTGLEHKKRGYKPLYEHHTELAL